MTANETLAPTNGILHFAMHRVDWEARIGPVSVGRVKIRLELGKEAADPMSELKAFNLQHYSNPSRAGY